MDPRELQARLKTLDEVEQYARGKMAQRLKKKHFPEPEQCEEAAPEAKDDDALDAESLQRLAAMAGD